MENKNKLMFGVLLFSVLFSLALVSSAITIDNPIASETVSGTYSFNATTTQENVTNCTWSTTADTNFSITLNTSECQTLFTNSTITTTLTDASSTTLTVTCFNSTYDYETATRTFSIDNTNPVCAFTLPLGEESIEHLDIYGVYPTDASTDAIDSSLTYAWTLYDPSSNSQATSTSSAPTFAELDFDEVGEFTLALTVTDDGSNSHNCANKTIMVYGSDDDETTILPGLPGVIKTFVTDNKSIVVIGGVAFLMILGALGFFAINKKKSLKK